jgi:hypothetical protein
MTKAALPGPAGPKGDRSALQPRGSAAQRLCSPEALQPGGAAVRKREGWALVRRVSPPITLADGGPGDGGNERPCASARVRGAAGRGLVMARTTRVEPAGAPADGMCAQVDADVTPSG